MKSVSERGKMEPKKKIEDYTIYTISCFACQSKTDLIMIAHRDSNNNIAGWIFSCTDCAKKFYDKKVKIEVENV